MTAHSWIPMELACRLGGTLAHSLWEGAALAAMLAIALAALPKRAANT